MDSILLIVAAVAVPVIILVIFCYWLAIKILACFNIIASQKDAMHLVLANMPNSLELLGMYGLRHPYAHIVYRDSDIKVFITSAGKPILTVGVQRFYYATQKLKAYDKEGRADKAFGVVSSLFQIVE